MQGVAFTRVAEDRIIQLHQGAACRVFRRRNRRTGLLENGRNGILGIGNLGLLREEGRQLLQRRHSGLEHVVKLRKLHDRLKHAPRVNHQRQQGTDLHIAAEHRVTAQH